MSTPPQPAQPWHAAFSLPHFSNPVPFLTAAAKESAAEEAARASRAVLVQFIALLEGSSAWATGAAWPAVVVAYTPLSAEPSPLVVAQGVGISLALTALGAVWVCAVWVRGVGVRCGCASGARRTDVRGALLAHVLIEGEAPVLDAAHTCPQWGSNSGLVRD